MAPESSNPVSSKLLLWILLGTIAVSIPLGFFIVRTVAPNVVSSGQHSAEEDAVSRLREILWAEDRVHELKPPDAIDRDKDGVAEYAFLGTLAGLDEKERVTQPPLGSGRWKKLAPGVYQAEGYAYAVYLPGEGQGIAAEGGAVDAKAASQRWIAYAWPVEGGAGQRAFVIDQDERICETPNTQQHYAGMKHLPTADAALPAPPAVGISECGPGRDGALWKAWRKKKARAAGR